MNLHFAFAEPHHHPQFLHRLRRPTVPAKSTEARDLGFVDDFWDFPDPDDLLGAPVLDSDLADKPLPPSVLDPHLPAGLQELFSPTNPTGSTPRRIP